MAHLCSLLNWLSLVSFALEFIIQTKWACAEVYTSDSLIRSFRSLLWSGLFLFQTLNDGGAFRMCQARFPSAQTTHFCFWTWQNMCFYHLPLVSIVKAVGLQTVSSHCILCTNLTHTLLAMMWICSKPLPQVFMYGTSFVWIHPKCKMLQVCGILNSICYKPRYPPFHQPCCCCNYWLEWNVFTFKMGGIWLCWRVEFQVCLSTSWLKPSCFAFFFNFFIHTAWLDVVLQGYF